MTAGRILWLLSALCGITCALAQAPPAAAPEHPPQHIRVVDAPGTNVELDVFARDDYLIVNITTNTHNFWLMKLTGVKGKTLTVGFSMDGIGNVSKWASLQPVYSYADPDQLQTYEWFVKERGRWRSGDALRPVNERDAGDGKSPLQQAIPAESADEFLSPEGAYWEPWKRITQIEAVAELNIFRFTQTYTQDTVWIAMRYPFSYPLLEKYIDALRAARHPSCAIREIGTSAENRNLYSVQVNSSRFFLPQPLTLVIYAREHATEPDGTWAIYGIINGLLDQSLAKWPRMILLPMIDPDSVGRNRYEGIIRTFGSMKPSKEAAAIQDYFYALVKDHRHPDIVLSLHNVEANEAGNLWLPHAGHRSAYAVKAIKARIEQHAAAQQYTVTARDPEWTMQVNRLEGWAARRLGSIDMVYELNAQAANRLTLQRLQEIGPLLVKAIDDSQINDQWFTILREQ